MEKKSRKSYSNEYKLQAVNLVLVKKQKISEVSRELGITENMLRIWRDKYLAKKDEAFPGHGNLSASDERIRKLEQENKRLREERDILKKAAIYFASDQ